MSAKESKTARKSAPKVAANRGPTLWNGHIPTFGGIYFTADGKTSRWYERQHVDRVFRGLLGGL